MRRFLATVPILLVVLLAFASAATAQAVRRVAHVGMLCLISCAPAPITNALSDELRKLGWRPRTPFKTLVAMLVDARVAALRGAGAG